jgi:hypothetical protein
MPDFVLNEDAVHKTGNETIGGIKTFTSPVYAEDGVSLKNNNAPLLQTGRTILYANASQFGFLNGNDKGAIFMYNNANSLVYTLPASTGTLALLSDFAPYLTIEGAESAYQTLANLSADLTASSTKYPSVNAVNSGLATKYNNPTGTTAQYIRGDGSLATFPTIPVLQWGNIGGTLSNQTDLQNALNAKFNTPTGTTSQYVRGDGSLATFPTPYGLLPTGGTAGQILTKVDGTDYNATWMDNYALWTSVIRHEVKAGEAIGKGQAVYVSPIQDGTNMIVVKADNTQESTSSKTLGLLMQSLSNNGFGQVITEGLLGGLNTSSATQGDPVWLGTNGNLIYGLANKPEAPNHLVFIGIVTRVNGSNGEIFVKVQNGFELEELHNVKIANKLNNEILTYEQSTGLWKNKSIATILGYTPEQTLTFSSPLIRSTNAVSIQQASASQSGYLSSADWNTFNNKQSALSFSGPLVLSGSTVYLLTASSAQNGYLSASDWSTFNAKQNAIGYTPANDTSVVHLTGSETITGLKYFFAGSKHDLLFVSETVGYASQTGYSHFKANTNHVEFINSTNTKATKFIHGNGAYEFTMPNASGTLALTSNLSSYLPLSGGTLTGALSGTSATFSGAINLTGTANSFQVASIFRNANRVFFGGDTGGYYFQNSGNTATVLQIADSGASTFSSSVTAGSNLTGTNTIFKTNDSSGYGIGVGYVSGSYGYVTSQSGNSPLALSIDGNPKLWVSTAGNVGVGTTAPIANFHVFATNGNGVAIGQNSTTSQLSANLFFYPSDTTSSKRNWAITTYYDRPELLQIRRSTTVSGNPYDNGVTLMTFDGINDRIGIGTTSPNVKLEVADVTSKIRLNSTTGGGNSALEWYVNTNYIGDITSSSGSGAMTFNQGPSAGWGGYISFKTDTTEKVRITNSGSLLVGTTQATAKLTIGDGAKASNSTPFAIQTSDANQMMLVVSRNINLYYNIEAIEQGVSYRSIYFNLGGGGVYAGTQRLDNNSDLRVKHNIQPVTNALNTIMSLSGKKFNMKDESNVLRYGFIAQEVQPILNDFVTQSTRSYKDEDTLIENILTLESSGTAWAALFVEAIKEQQVQIQDLKQQLKNK